MRILILTLALFTFYFGKACAGGGYSQVYPIAKTTNDQLWVWHLNGGRDGHGTKFEYKSELHLLSSDLKLIKKVNLADSFSIDTSVGEEMPLTQFEPTIRVLYNKAVGYLKDNNRSLTFLQILGTTSITLDSLSLFHIDKIEKEDTASIIVLGDSTEEVEIYFSIQSLSFREKTHVLDSLQSYFSDSGSFLDYGYDRVEVHGIKHYEIEGQVYVVLHFELMFAYKMDTHNYEELNVLADKWHPLLYQPIGWHHGGQEILFRLE